MLPAETSAAAASQAEPQDKPAPWQRPELAVLDGGAQPDSRSPDELVISEGRLIRMLERHYGWVRLDERSLIRRKVVA